MNTIANRIANTAISPQPAQNINVEARRLGIGGSDIAPILGISPFKTAYEVYEEKVEGKDKDLSDNEKVLWGTLLEDPIAQRYEQLTGNQLFCTGMIKHEKYPFFIAHPDRIMPSKRRGLEIKAVGEHTKHLWGEPGSQVIPEYYYTQIAHYMLVLDYPVWDLAVLIGGQEFRTYTFERDKEFDDIIIEQGSKFWKNHVEKRCPPPIDYTHPHAKAFIKRKFKVVSEQVICLSDDFLPITDAYEETKAQLKQYNQLKDELEAKILDGIQEAGVARLSDGRFFTRNLVERKGYAVLDARYTTLNLRKGASR